MNKLIRNLKKRISILESYRANSDIEYRYKTTGRFIQNGEILCLINTLANYRIYSKIEFSFNEFITINLANLPTNKEDAINFVISELTKLINAEEEILNTKKRLKNFFEEKKEFIKSIHTERELSFIPMSVKNFNNSINYKLYKSPVYNRRQSSEYRLLLIDGKIAYARKSNHWGAFSTTVYAQTNEEMQEADEYGRLGYKSFTWLLKGANNDARSSQAGYILLED